MNRIRKISSRDNGFSAVDPESFESEYLLGPQKINNISNLVNNLYYLGYKDQKSIIEQLKLRGIESDSVVKESIKKCLEILENREETQPKK